VSISYGEAETQNGAADNAYINNLYATAAAEGVSVFVSAGDEGAASADAGASSASHGISVSAYASTPNNVAVGGTDFADGYNNDTSTYWSSTNGPAYNSALSYIPEIPWNGSCASQLLATTLGFSTTYGASGLCASPVAEEDSLLEVVAGSGGPSNCATGAPSESGVASGTCKGYAKPSWQSVYGNPADGVRDIPDVAMFASNGIWGHYYVVCYSDPGRGRGGVPCTGAPSNWAGFGGTSVSSPIMAGVQALINQKTNMRQGNPAAALYSLARSEYGSGGNSACNSSGGAGTCAFHDVTLGDMDVNCSSAGLLRSGGPTKTR
jgi:subtilisin family serine protease